VAKPIIGITAGRYNVPPPAGGPERPLMACGIRHVEAVLRSGGAAVMLPRTTDTEVVAAVLPALDGLYLSGGGDISSLVYGEEPHPASMLQDPERDAMELEAVRLAVGVGLPVLAVCRGLQVLNVALGGTVLQDIPTQVPNAVQHYAVAADRVLLHTVDVDPDSLLATVFGETSLAVSSLHHQAVGAVADGLRVNCRARDGIIEGLEARDGRPILGVQCHPEARDVDYAPFRRLYDWFVDEAGRRAGSRDRRHGE
jgi:putative glutamine amidotransferase